MNAAAIYHEKFGGQETKTRILLKNATDVSPGWFEAQKAQCPIYGCYAHRISDTTESRKVSEAMEIIKSSGKSKTTGPSKAYNLRATLHLQASSEFHRSMVSFVWDIVWKMEFD